MWLKSGGDHLNVPENVEDIKQVTILSKGMAFSLIKLSREEFMDNRKITISPDGRPWAFYFNKEEHRIMFNPRADKRYSVSIRAWISKLL